MQYWCREDGKAYYLAGAGEMHTTMWGDDCGALDANPLDGAAVVVLRNVEGKILVCPANEIETLFQVTTDAA